ncbi:MAG: LysM peptidoglycan-binding domain-containing protein [Eubacteriaceae bacterium]|nr:LysM peptidoglycan-binding domain-containing protein [Eubacteriaceae bacterium]
MTKRRIRIRIVNKKRLVFSLTLIAILAVSCVFGTVMGKEEQAERTYVEYTVTSGDTLWSIAQKHNYAKTDVREIIYNIKEANALVGSTVEQGRTILIPLDM